MNLWIKSELESLDPASFKIEIPTHGACIFTGMTKIYDKDTAEDFSNRVGHIPNRGLNRGLLLAICNKTADKLTLAFSKEIAMTLSTWHYDGAGCC